MFLPGTVTREGQRPSHHANGSQMVQSTMPESLKEVLKVTAQEHSQVIKAGKTPPKERKQKKAAGPVPDGAGPVPDGPASSDAQHTQLVCSDCDEGGTTSLVSEGEGG